MGIIWSIIVGFLAGLVARLIHPGRDDFGLIMTTLIGIGGSLIATFLGQALGLYRPGQPAGFIGAVIGAVVLLWIYARTRGRPARQT